MSTTITPGADPVAAVPARTHRTDHLVIAAALLLCLVIFVPGITRWAYNLRPLVIWPMAGWGLVMLGRLAWAGDRAARWLVGFLAWALVAAAASPRPWMSFDVGFTTYGAWLSLVGYAGWWGLGRRISTQEPAVRTTGQDLLVAAIVVGCVLNLVAAVGQLATVVGDDGPLLLRRISDRPVGFMGNSVFLGPLLAGAVALSAARALRSGAHLLWWPAIAVFFAGVELSGARIALLGAVVVVVALVMRKRPGARLAVAIGAMLVLGWVMAMAFPVAGESVSSTGRVSSTSGIGARTAMWETGAQATMERPLTGWGPGQFRLATESRITPEFVRSEGANTFYGDAHNAAIEVLTTTGLVGAVLMAGFVWHVVARTRGDLAWFALPLIISWAVEPQVPAVVAPVMLAVGAADRTRSRSLADAVETPGLFRHLSVAGVLVGLLLSLRLVVASHHVYQARANTSPASARAALDLYPRDPHVADTLTRVLHSSTLTDDDRVLAAETVRSAERTVELDPDGVDWWYRLSAVVYRHGPSDGSAPAEASRLALVRAHELSPWRVSVLADLHHLAVESGDEAQAAHWEDLLCQVDSCPGDELAGLIPEDQ